jgi:hypothetical protein
MVPNHGSVLNAAQISKFNAKLRLIEHGLLVPAKMLDEVNLQESRKGEGEDEDEDGESIEEFEARLHKFVQGNLQRASSSKRDHYKDDLVYQARKEVIVEFMRAVVSRKKCANCNACVGMCLSRVSIS